MAYKTEFQSNNADLQSILDTINSMSGGTAVETGSFIPTNSGGITYKSKFGDNNIDLQRLLEMLSLLPDLPENSFKIVYNANGGTFSNGIDINTVCYKISTQQKEVTETKISKTSNILDDGTQNGSYPIGITNDIITIDGAKFLDIIIKYCSRSYSYAYTCIYDKSITPTTSNYNDSISNRLYSSTLTTKTFTVNGDTAQFYFNGAKKYSSTYDYGYYAIISANVIRDFPVAKNISGIEKLPIKDNMFFYDWYLEPECINKLVLEDIVENTTVYAKWLTETELLLIDFEYIENDNGTFTLTDWKGTLNGKPSTKIVIPNDSRIIL